MLEREKRVMGGIDVERHTFGHLAALFTIVNWGTTFISTKILLRGFTPVEILVYRFILGLLVLYLLCPKLLRGTSLKEELTFVAAGLTGGCLYFLLENIALTYTGAANVGIIITTSPMFTALFAWWAGKEKRPSLRFFIGFLIAVSGIAIISFNGASEVAMDWRGDALALIAAAVWGIYSMLVQKVDSFGYNILQTTRRTFLYGLVFMIPAAMMMDFSWDLTRLAEPAYLGNLVYLGIGASALCFVSWGMAVTRLGPVKTSVYLYLSPVITMICSAIVLDEHLTGISLIGAGLTLTGLIVSQWEELRGQKKVGASKSEP